MTVITRFPPSPTGFMHLGTARTALFNWLYARSKGGKMVFRIEDTDRARHSEEAVQGIIRGLGWLGLDWDGPVISQFERSDRHAEVAKQLLAEGKAYYCYCTPEELDEMRAQATKEGRPTFYDRRWRDADPASAPKDVKPVIRLKAPLEGSTIVEDLIQGSVEVENKNLDDFILLRSDGTPTYMLAVVVDDHDMGVTHVIRGDDHLNNTFRQNVIISSMGWDMPIYAHTPMILGADGSKLSKRHGATNVEDYKKLGYLPEAMLNCLMRLGWGHGNDEIISLKQAVEWFDIKDVTASPARLDVEKLNHLNAHYIKQAEIERLIDLTVEILAERSDVQLDETAIKRLGLMMEELRNRAKTIVQIADEGAFLAKTVPYAFDDKAKEILNDDAKAVLAQLRDRLAQLDNFVTADIEATGKQLAADIAEGKMAKVGMPLRAALTGTGVSPSIFAAAEVLGKDEVLARLDYALKS